MLLAQLYLNAEVYTGTPRVRRGARGGAAGDRRAVQRSTPTSGTCSWRTTTRRPRSSSPCVQTALHTQTYGGMTFLIHAACGGTMDPAHVGMDGGWYGLRLARGLRPLRRGRPAAVPISRPTAGRWTSPPSATSTTASPSPKFQNVTSTGRGGSNAHVPGHGLPDVPPGRCLPDLRRGRAARRRRRPGNRRWLRERAAEAGLRQHRANIADAELTLRSSWTSGAASCCGRGTAGGPDPLRPVHRRRYCGRGRAGRRSGRPPRRNEISIRCRPPSWPPTRTWCRTRDTDSTGLIFRLRSPGSDSSVEPGERGRCELTLKPHEGEMPPVPSSSTLGMLGSNSHGRRRRLTKRPHWSSTGYRMSDHTPPPRLPRHSNNGRAVRDGENCALPGVFRR